MQIYINNKLAALKQGTSVEFVAENRLFGGSDGYTLNITFPLRGCAQNIAIFGHLHRADVTPARLVMDCEIRARGFHRYGSVVVTEITECEVKTQFLEGRSEQNFRRTLDSVYINELDLGCPDTGVGVSPAMAWCRAEAVALPWVLDSKGSVQNRAEWVEGAYRWHADTRSLSWQPYLIHVVRRVCAAVGYAVDLSAWEARQDVRRLLVCNALPSVWGMPGYAHALPHWSVEEFLGKLELFLDCEFDIDHRGRTIVMAFTADRLAATPPVVLTGVVDEHSTAVAAEEADTDYREAKNLVYKDCSHAAWKFYSCDWFTRNAVSVKRFERLEDALSAYRRYKTWDGTNGRSDCIDDVVYAADVDAHFIVEPVSREPRTDSLGRTAYTYTCRLRAINLFGGRIVDAEADSVEVDVVPVRVDDTEAATGRLMFVEVSGVDSAGDEADDYAQPNALRRLKAGHQQKSTEFFDRLFVAWWDGTIPTDGTLPHPHVEDIEISSDWSGYRKLPFSLRLRGRQTSPPVDPRRKTTFRFLADSIPDPRATFLIRGHRYLAQSITATLTDHGPSRLLRGTFLPLTD